MEKKENREREKRGSVNPQSSNYRNNLQVYLNFPASYVP